MKPSRLFSEKNEFDNRENCYNLHFLETLAYNFPVESPKTDIISEEFSSKKLSIQTLIENPKNK